MWLMILPWEHCPTGGVFMVAKLKQIQTKSSPYDSHLGTLSVGQTMANGSPLGALSHWRRVYCSQIKTNANKIYPNDSHLRTLSLDQNVVNDSPLGALSPGGVFIVAKLKQIQTKSNPYDFVSRPKYGK